MTEKQKNELAAPIVALFMEMEDVLLRKIAKQLGADGDLSDASKWRIRQLARAGLLDREAVKTIRSYTGIQSDMLDVIIETAALHEIDHLDYAVQAADAAALSGAAVPPAEDTAMNAMRSFRRQAQKDINAVNTVMRYKTKQAFVTAVNEAFWDAEKSQRVYNALGMGTAEVVIGAASLQTGIRDAISKLSEKGIPAFIDKAGREWSPEAYVRMDVKSTVGNTARQAMFDRCDEYGIDLVEVDAHAGARPLCAPYQGRIYSRNGKSGKAKDGGGNEIEYVPIESTSVGEKAGLFGINCGHHPYPFVPGVNFKTYYPLETEEALEENAKQYAKFQKQRYYERQIRNAKKDCMMQKAANDDEGFTKASQKLARRREAYNAYCKAQGLPKELDRTQVFGFDRSMSAKATWANRKAKLAADKGLTSGAASGKIKSVGDTHSIKSYPRSELKKMIEKSNSLDKPIFAADTETNRFASYARNIKPEPGFYDVALHGNITSAEFFGKPINASDLAKIIKSRDDYKIGTPIRLFSCNTGNISETGDCFAQLLANEMRVKIKAPEDLIYVNPDGSFFIGDPSVTELKPFWSRK